MNIELFPCAGGMAEGFKRAGIYFDLAIEWEADHCASYLRNIGHECVHMDVRELLWLAEDGFRFKEPIDLLVADPPCTPWSRAGKRLGVKDERDMLGVTARLIELLRPKCYLIGNVPGLADSTQWHHPQAALAPLAKAGYCVRDYASLDAADFGVPQHRVRPFWFGHTQGPCIQWPARTHCDPALLSQCFLPGPAFEPRKPWVTCADALGHLSPNQLGRLAHLRGRWANGEGKNHRRWESDGSKPTAWVKADPIRIRVVTFSPSENTTMSQKRHRLLRAVARPEAGTRSALAMGMDMTIGHTILEQMGGPGRISAMTGARFQIGVTGVTIKFPNPSGRPNAAAIDLAVDDTYTMKFFRGAKTVAVVQGVHCDQLRYIFETNTGLLLSL